MNRNFKATTIAAGTGVATYVGEIVQWLIEKAAGDMPDNIDAAITGLIRAMALETRNRPTCPAECHVVPPASWPCSRRTTSVQPFFARW